MIETPQIHPRAPLFSDSPPTPATHFRLRYLEAVLHVLGQAAQSLGSQEALFEQYPFLHGYREELASQGLVDVASDGAEASWRDSVSEWEESVPGHLPLRSLTHAAALDAAAVSLLFGIGLPEEDARFGMLFEALQGLPGQRRPTVGLLNAWWRPPEDNGEVRARLRSLEDLALAQVVNPEAPRLEWALQPLGLIWDALRGQQSTAPAPWLCYHAPEDLKPLSALILPDGLRQTLKRLPALVTGGGLGALVVRGPQNNGRKTLLGAVARTLERGLLEVRLPLKYDDERWRMVGSLASLLHALPTVTFELAPGETAELPRLGVTDSPLGVVLGRAGGLAGPGAEAALTLTLDIPGSDARRALWAQSFGPAATTVDLGEVSDHCRLTSGNIQRTATLAKTCAALSSDGKVTPAEILEARRSLHRHTLDHLAARVHAVGDWGQLAAGPETFAELRALECRCRNREQLPRMAGTAFEAQLNAGVRALFSGPSGTGKTLAARLLASVLRMDLYRLDLAAVVNKYIGETEKNLSQIFARAEELDVILLLDEGDALLTQRTAVQTANDRYANLETNYLLQRIESFEGILIVTTNAADRIDSAFQRRMDVIVTFRPPDLQERWAIWQLHLPPVHQIGSALLGEVAARCALTGGQIRNAALHAAVLAIEDGGVVTSLHLEAAVQREYRKAGAVCPLRQFAARA
jgi:hypothetical protein